MEKKLLLINPKTENCADYKFFPPIALCIIEALTPENWNVTILDENIDSITSYDYDLVGITSSHHFLRAYDIADLFRKKSVPVVMGGLHVSAVPDEAKNHADSIVIGDVESVWKQVIQDSENGRLQNFYKSDILTYNFAEPSINYFYNKYFAYALETSRGCFNNCMFCGIHIPYHRLHKRKPVALVINELRKSKNPFVFIIDNNFFGNDESYMFDLFDEIEKNKIRKVFFAGVSVDFFKNEKLVSRAAKCGLKMVFVGFESDTVQSLKKLNKKNYKNAEDIFNEYREIVRMAHKHRILISGKVMIGIENDTEEIIDKRIDFFIRLKLDELSCAILTPLPMSDLFKQLQLEDRLLYHDFPADWIKYDYNNLSFKLQSISKEKVDYIQTRINAENRPRLRHIFKSFLISRSLRGVFLYYAYSHYFFYYKNKFLSGLIIFYSRLNRYKIPKFN